MSVFTRKYDHIIFIHLNPYSTSVAIWQQALKKFKKFFDYVFGISKTFKCSKYIVVERPLTARINLSYHFKFSL